MIFLFVCFFLFFVFYCLIYKNSQVVYWLSFFYTAVLFFFFSYKLFSFKTLILQEDVLGLASLILYKNLNQYCSKFEVLFDYFDFMLDGVAVVLLWLTSFIVFLCLMYLYNVCGFSLAKHCVLLIVIETILLCCFLVKNLLSFFICFEFLLIPMICLIGLGSRGRKEHAVFFFFFFTFVSSILLLIGIGFIYIKTETLLFQKFNYCQLSKKDQIFIFYVFFFGFCAKIPLMPLHVWLPEAHVEAPTVGSVLLASILLKLGAYGLFRVVFTLCDLFVIEGLFKFIAGFLLFSVLFASLHAIRQLDLKKIVAYSSVVHMSFSLFGLFSIKSIGLSGFLFLLVSHGLISAGMFFCVGMLYDRFHTRNILYYGGLVQFMPIFSCFFFIFIFSNMSLPGTCNFVGELFVLLSIFQMCGFVFSVIVFVSLFMTVLFCLILLYKVIFYQLSQFLTCNLVDLTLIEMLILIFLSFYIFLFGILPNALLCFFFF